MKFSRIKKKINKEKSERGKLLKADCVSAKAQLAPFVENYFCVYWKKHPEFFLYPETIFFACNPAVRGKENERNKEYNACQIHPENIDP